MQMTNPEIVTSYRQAKKQTEQIKVLAELNACSTDEIINILVVDGGYDPRKFSKPKAIIKNNMQPLPKKQNAKPSEKSWKPETWQDAVEIIKKRSAELWKKDKELAARIAEAAEAREAVQAEIKAIDEALGNIIDGGA